MRLGLAMPLPGMGLVESIEMACIAERAGFEAIWSSEVASYDGFTPLAALAMRTTSIRLGVAVVPAATRPAALLAMTAATLAELSGGRFALGLGASSPTIVERWMGGTPDALRRPLTRVRETVEALRLALTAEKVSFDGTTLHMRDFRLEQNPSNVPILLGALGPRMYRLAGEIADGVVVTFVTAERLPDLLRDTRAGLNASTRPPEGFDVVCRIPVGLDEDHDKLCAAMRRFIARYAIDPSYNALLVRQGFAVEAGRIGRAWAAGQRTHAAAAVGDKLLEALCVLGPRDACFDRLGAFARAGATTLLISPVTAATDPRERRQNVQRAVEAIVAWRESVNLA